MDGYLELWLALTFFGLAWVFWCGWWFNYRKHHQEALLCFWYSVVLEFGGFMALTVSAMSSGSVAR